MLRWLALVALALAAGVLVFTNSLKFHRYPRYAPPQPSCRAHAWVRAPDMVPGDVIAGDVRIKLHGPCNKVESYELGLHYKEKIFWKFSPEFESRSMNANHDVSHQVQMPFQNSGNPHYNEMQLALQFAALQNSGQNEDSWSVHEEERIAFEIKTPLASTEGADPLSRSFTSRFGILVPNTNYPPGLDYRHCVSGRYYMGHVDAIHSESIYEYFVQIRFSDGVIWKVPAGITAFTPFYLSTEDKAPNVNVSLAPADILNSRLRERSSNYTVEVSFPEEAYVNQNSSVDIMATVHRTGYTNRTDLPVELCASLESTSEWRPQELKNLSAFVPFIKLLVPSPTSSMGPSMQRSRVPPPFSRSVCKEVKFAAAPGDLTREGHISSTSSEPLSLSLHVGHDAIRAFSTYYQKLGHRVDLNLYIKPDPSEQYDHEFGIPPCERTGWMDESDYDWVPWLSPMQARRRHLTGNASLSFIPMQDQRPVQTTPVHYLSNEARQPIFVDVSDIADLRSMTSEKRDLIAPIAQPSIEVFEGGPGHPNFYFDCNKGRPIYVGDTWLNKVAVEGYRKREMDSSLHQCACSMCSNRDHIGFSADELML